VRAVDEVERDARHGQTGQHRVSLPDVVEVGGDHDLRSALDRGQPGVGALERLQLRGCAVLDQHGLVDLHPLGAELAELGEHLGVDVDERVEQLETVELLAGALALQQEGQGPDQHRLGLDALLLGLRVLLERLPRGETELHVAGELGHDVVVVRVEPLRHLHRRHVDTAGLAAARHREVRVLVHVARTVPAVALRDCAHHRDRVQHLVVEREVVRRDQVDAGIDLLLPVRRAQVLCRRCEVLERAVSCPVRLGRGLELTLSADARESQHGGQCLWQENLLERGMFGGQIGARAHMRARSGPVYRRSHRG
jgi:hypothetical protein